MIREAFEYLTTPAPRWARQSGHLRALIDTGSRFRRWARHWQPHLDATKHFITKSAQRCPQKRTSLVLGSGYLLDTPIEWLSSNFDTVVLADVAHPRTAIQTVKGFSNIQRLEIDICNTSARQMADSIASQSGSTKKIDLVVSANLLSQLAIVPLEQAKKNKPLDDWQTAEFCHNIFAAHLHFLAQFDAVQCLVTERKSDKRNRQGDVVETNDALCGLELPPHDETWVWDIAPLGERSPEFSVRNEIVAFQDFRAAQCRSKKM